jgi:hypothetical protein
VRQQEPTTGEGECAHGGGHVGTSWRSARRQLGTLLRSLSTHTELQMLHKRFDAEGASEASERVGGVRAPSHACATQLPCTHAAEGTRGVDQQRGNGRLLAAGPALAACALVSSGARDLSGNPLDQSSPAAASCAAGPKLCNLGPGGCRRRATFRSRRRGGWFGSWG